MIINVAFYVVYFLGVLANIAPILLPLWHTKVSSLLWYIFSLIFILLSWQSFAHFQRVRDGVAVQHFTFVLTDLEGCQRFGFCRLTNSTNTCLCILRYVCLRVCVQQCLQQHDEIHLCSISLQLSSMVWSVLQTSQQFGWLPDKRTGKFVCLLCSCVSL